MKQNELNEIIMKNLILLTLLITFSSSLFAQSSTKEADALVFPRLAEKVITVGGSDADIGGFNNQSIQYAIDAVAGTGGTVKLSPGTFEINSPVRMKSHVKLIGSGSETILKKGEGVQTRFIIDADYGELKLTVE